MSETVHDPRFLCELCGYANVRLTDEGALCTSCGTRYLQPDADREEGQR